MTNLKNILVTVSMVLMSITSFGQITIVENNDVKVGSLKNGLVESGYMTKHNDGSFSFNYKDYKYRQIESWKSITFNNIDEVVQFRDIINGQYSTKKNSTIEFNLSDGTYVQLETKKSLGMVYLNIWVHDNGIVSYNGINPKQMEGLFGFIN